MRTIGQRKMPSLDAYDAAAYVALLMQPHEGTVGLIGAGLLRLAEDANLREASIVGKLPWERFGEEVLRYDPPIQNTRRTLAADATIEGKSMRSGDSILLVLASAARDPALHDAPDVFNVDRTPGTSSVLGDGAHACPGGSGALAIAACTRRYIVKRTSAAFLGGLAKAYLGKLPLMHGYRSSTFKPDRPESCLPTYSSRRTWMM